MTEITAQITTQTFDEIAPGVRKYAESRLRCPDLISLSVTLAWYYWAHADKPDLPPSVWARCGVSPCDQRCYTVRSTQC
jgi:hypothetical protein